MKSKNLFRISALLLLFTAVIIVSCKKDKKEEEPAPDSSSLQQLSKDQSEMEVTSNLVINDVSNVISGGNGKSLNGIWWPCHVTIDSAAYVNDSLKYTIIYNGLNCEGTFNITGKIEVMKKKWTYWGQAGMTVNVKFIDLKLTNVASGKSITYNGKAAFTNVSGGYLVYLENGSPLTSMVHKAHGYFVVTFDDGTTKTWNFERKRTFKGKKGAFVMTVEGVGSAGGYNNLLVWGTSRNNEDFYSEVTEPIVHKEVCLWYPVAGSITHQVPSGTKKITVTFGFDDNNQPVPVTSNNCPTRYRVDWVIKDKSGTAYIQM